MPEVASAYRPSGALPASAALLLLLGAVVGCVGGAVAGALIAGTGLFLAGVVFRELDLPGWSQMVQIALFFAAFVLALIASGCVSAWCTTEFGRWGKNRNIGAAVLLAMLASTVPVVCACGCYFHFGAERTLNKLVLDGGLSPLLWVWLWEPLFVISAVFGLLSTVATAGVYAAYRVVAAKFCESCQTFMGSRSKTVSLGCLRALVRAARNGRTDVVASLLHGPTGTEGEVRLYSCPSCSRGYLEVTAKYNARWAGIKTGGSPYALQSPEITDSWLTVSLELNANDVERLRPLLVGD